MPRIAALIILLVLCAGLVTGTSHANEPADKQVRKDLQGDLLPADGIVRFGSARLRHGGVIQCIAISKDDKSVASCGFDGTVRLRTDKGFWILNHANKYVRHAAFSPDGKTLASAAWDEPIILWDTSNGKERLRIASPKKGADWVGFSTDGKLLLSYGNHDKIRIWDAENGKEIRSIEGYAPAVSPDGKSLISGIFGGKLAIWDLATGGKLKEFKGQATIDKTTISPDGKLVATAHEGNTISLWDVESAKLVKNLTLSDCSMCSAAFASDGKTIVTGSLTHKKHYGDALCLWDVSTGNRIRNYAGHCGSVHATAFSQDGKRILAGGYFAVRSWDAATGKEIAGDSGHQGQLTSIAISGSGKVLATAGHDATVRLWDVDTGKQLRMWECSKKSPPVVAMSPDGKVVASGSDEEPVQLWDTATGKSLRRLDAAKVSVRSLAFSHDGKTLAEAGGYPFIRLWNVETGKKLQEISLKEGGIHVAFSPDGKKLFYDRSFKFSYVVQVWDIAAAKQSGEFQSCPGRLESLACSADGTTVATGEDHHILRLWHMPTGKLLHAMGCKGRIFAVSFSPDGKSVASTASMGKAVRIWDVLTGEQRCNLGDHAGDITAISFSPDGRVLFSASEDCTAMSWDLTRKYTRSRNPGEKDLPALWTALRGEASKADEAIWSLAAVPELSVPYLQKQLKSTSPLSEEQISKLIAEFNHDEFARRDKATEELEKIGQSAEPALRKALSGKLSEEARQRSKTLLDKLEALSQEHLQLLRAVEVLEHIGTKEAKAVLESFAKDSPRNRCRAEAKAAIERLSRRN